MLTASIEAAASPPSTGARTEVTLLRLDSFSVTNGPELHVMLSPHPDPTRGSEVRSSGYADLGILKGNKGDQKL